MATAEAEQPVTKAELFQIIQDVKGDIASIGVQMHERLARIENDLSAVKNDLSAVKNDLSAVKNDLAQVKNNVGQLITWTNGRPNSANF